MVGAEGKLPAAAGTEKEFKPYVPAGTVLPEMTVKVFIVGIILSWVMSSANAYLGLYAALTVSAAIPASVISMAVLRFFKHRNILENNLIQTTASAGESVTAGIIFVLPALLFIGYWDAIGIWETIIIAALGGSLGVLFTIPLRRAFIVEAKLQYPEGVATVEVLKSGEKGGSGIGYIVVAAISGAVYKFLLGALELWKGIAEMAARIGNSGVYFGANLSPALVAVGFIVGLPIAVLIFAGGFISYGIAIPVWLSFNPWPQGLDAVDAFGFVRSRYIRFIGVGAMATGGVYTLIKLRGALAQGFRSGLAAYRAMRTEGKDTRVRTERDIGMRSVLTTLVLFLIPLTVLFMYFITDKFRSMEHAWVGLVLAVIMLLAGFLFSAVAGYMAGVVGSSNNPISGTAIGTILFTGLLLVGFNALGLGLGPTVAAAATILIGSTIASAAAIAGDNMQDLKAGYLLGGTPKNLQIMQMVGAVAASVSLPFVLMLLHKAYVIGSNSLPAAQAGLMFAISSGLFGIGDRDIPWEMFWIGVGVAIAIIALDLLLERRGSKFRVPVLAVAVGIYLPFDLATPIFLGGLIAYFAHRRATRTYRSDHPQATTPDIDHHVEHRMSRGILFASGLIAGEALMGIMVAGILAGGELDANQNPVSPLGLRHGADWYWQGAIIVLFLAFLIFYSVVRPERAGDTVPADSLPVRRR